MFLVILNIVILVAIIKIIQRLVSNLAHTSKPMFHNIYQGGELLQAKNRKYQSNLYPLFVIFLILHVFVFLLISLVFINIKDNLPILALFIIIFIYTVVLIRKGVDYS